jgi:hypothetical protein
MYQSRHVKGVVVVVAAAVSSFNKITMRRRVYVAISNMEFHYNQSS